MIGLAAADSSDNDVPAATDWREAPLFVPPSNGASAAIRAQGEGDESGDLQAPFANDRDVPEARATDLSVWDVAWAAGFENISHFRRIFGREVGLRPRDFRSVTGNPASVLS
jgi:hypothetical protein